MDVDMPDPLSPPAPSANGNTDILTSLSEPLRSYALTAFPPDIDDDNNSDGDMRRQEGSKDDDDKSKSIASRRLDGLEISLRSHALHLVEELMQQADDSTEFHTALETLLHFLKDVTFFTVDLVQLVAASNDNTRSQLPQSYSNATAQIFLRIPMTLLSDMTAALPISTVQRLWSSVPNWSPFHPRSGYVSHLCHPSTFIPLNKMLLLRICNHLLKCCSNRDVDAEFAGSVMTTLAHVFPLSERSAMNVLGSFNVDNVTGWEGEEEFQRGRRLRGVAVAGEGSGGLGEESMEVDDESGGGVYRSSGTILSPNGGFEAFENFIKHIKTILAAFESTPAIASSTSKIASSLEGVTHYKYLTSSQLLHLQLKDPEIRTQFLTQLIILLAHLNSPSVTLPTPPISSTPGSNPSKLNAQLKQTQMNQLSELEKRTQQLLKSIKPEGESHLRAVCWILKERESMWRNWKKNKCFPPLEKVPANGAKIVSSHDIRNILSGKKRKASDTAPGTNDIIGINTNLPNVMSTIKKSLPTLDVYLEPYVEALDPEAEVDAEYHPGNDKVYCWRALRLLARSQEGEGQLRRFVHLRRKDGNFEGIVRGMWKEDKGEEIPGSYVEIDDEEFQFKSKREEKPTGDADMEDVSVGTPEVDEAAKKEKMSEFEKAAMEVEEEMLNEPEGKATASDESEKVQADDNTKTEIDDKNGSNGERAKKDEGIPRGMVTERRQQQTKGQVNADVPSEEATAPDNICEESTVKEPKESDSKEDPTTESKSTPKEKTATELQPSKDSPAQKENSVKGEPTPPSVSVSKTATRPEHEKPNPSTNHDNGGKDREPSISKESKPKDQPIKPAAKFVPRDQIRQKQHQNKIDQSETKQKQHQDHTKDHPSATAGANAGSGPGSGRDTGGTQDRRGSDARRGPPHHQYHQRGGRYGNKEESHIPVEKSHESSGASGGSDARDKRNDRYHNAPSQGGGRGSGWQPPSQGAGWRW
ncbi:hypothetical protein HJC23_008667 [Cyclotella cryptica]|uniref:THO complex subunit 1 n=1 Tax=Cyclotella cryptica TaxID=29204 RepID=A0ABD3QGQ3_9STRA